MPKNGDVIRGQFQEIINPHLPIKWDDPAPVAEPEHVQIGRDFATAAKPQEERARRSRVAQLSPTWVSDQIARIERESK